MAMPMKRAHAAIGIAVMMAMAAGCSYRELAAHERTGTSARPLIAFKGAPVAKLDIVIGGVVLGSGARLDDLCGVDPALTESDLLAQADAWSRILLDAMTAGPEKVSVWPWAEVRNRLAAGEIEAYLGVFASGGVLRPERLAPVRAAFPSATHLAVARVDYNLLEDRSLIQASGLRGSIGRTIEVTLDCYELDPGTSAWRATRRVHDFGKHLKGDNPDDHHVRVRRDSGGNVDVEVPGVTASAPRLEDMIADAVDALVMRMLAAARLGPDWQLLE